LLDESSIKNDVDMIWASSKGMHMLTTSQLQNYKIDCDKFMPQATSYKRNGIKDFQQYITEMVKPFLIKLQLRGIKITFDLKLSSTELARDLCCDWKVYESIFYHIMSNAVKYSPSNSEIQVII
jgi:signal transduction histidine kinase